MDTRKRPSVYLADRCAAIQKAFRFLLEDSPVRPRTEKLVAFLVQIDFWDWELDNLIYSFTSFKERAQAWEFESGTGLANGLRSKGIVVRSRAVKGIKGRRKATAKWRAQVVAPFRTLATVVETWNAVLKTCEDEVMVAPEDRQKAVNFGAQVLLDLSKYRKTRLELPADDWVS